MSNQVWTFDDIYNQFLTYLASCTFADLTDTELESELEKFLLRGLAEFRFPQVELAYSASETEPIVYTFTDEKFCQREVNVIIAYMKKYYLEWLVSKEKNFAQQYYDNDTRTHSQANMVQQINAAYKTAIKEADATNYDYSRMDTLNRQPRIGAVNA